MFNFKSLFGQKKNGSKDLAAERLRLVLIHDRMETSCDFFDEMERELMGVIEKYVEVDSDLTNVSISRSDKSIALEANIAIKNVKRPARAGKR